MNPYSTVLCHHGILGQKWGKKNGPPYPLDAEKHSAAEKAAGYAKSIKSKIQNGSKKLISNAKEAWKDPVKKRKLIERGKTAAAISLAVAGTYIIAKDELRPVPKTITKYDHIMPIYGAKGKMLFPPRTIPRTEQIMVPNYVTRGHKSVNNLMNKVGKGFDLSKLTMDELKQLDLY